MTMPRDPDLSQAWHQGHYGTREEAEAVAAGIETLAVLHGQPIPHTEVTPDHHGGWNIWFWE
jgi:hypothetical protein